MKKTALVILAAGIGSRFGGGIKQLEPVGPNGEIIMDYSIHDALEAGFNKVVFIIRKDLEKDFKEVIGNRIEKITEVEYAYQELNDLPEGFSVPDGRTKPWGTGQALLSCRGIVKEPFVVINADDYYGKEGFVKIHDYLVAEHENTDDKMDICLKGDTSISRENHARLAYDKRHNAFHIIPADGTNAVYLNDEPVYVPMALKADDIIEIGDYKLCFVPFCNDKFTWD